MFRFNFARHTNVFARGDPSPEPSVMSPSTKAIVLAPLAAPAAWSEAAGATELSSSSLASSLRSALSSGNNGAAAAAAGGASGGSGGATISGSKHEEVPPKQVLLVRYMPKECGVQEITRAMERAGHKPLHVKPLENGFRVVMASTADAAAAIACHGRIPIEVVVPSPRRRRQWPRPRPALPSGAGALVVHVTDRKPRALLAPL